MNYLIIDTETCNSLDDPIVYDVGAEVFNDTGQTLEIVSLTNKDIFLDKEFMSSAYYADKIPTYWKEIWANKRELLSWNKIKDRIYSMCARHDCSIAVAHNARFDNRALNLTQRYITTSKHRYFLPYNCIWWDTLRMAREVLKGNDTYKNFCKYYNFMTSNNQPKFTAEVLYKFLSGDIDFEEKHVGIEDIKIEKEIFLWCLNQKPDIDGRLWRPKPEPPRKLEPWKIELQELLS